MVLRWSHSWADSNRKQLCAASCPVQVSRSWASELGHWVQLSMEILCCVLVCLLPVIESLAEEGQAPEEELASADRNRSHTHVFVSVTLCIWRTGDGISLSASMDSWEKSEYRAEWLRHVGGWPLQMFSAAARCAAARTLVCLRPGVCRRPCAFL